MIEPCRSASGVKEDAAPGKGHALAARRTTSASYRDGCPYGCSRIGAPGVFDQAATSSGFSNSAAPACDAAKPPAAKLPSRRRRLSEGEDLREVIGYATTTAALQSAMPLPYSPRRPCAPRNPKRARWRYRRVWAAVSPDRKCRQWLVARRSSSLQPHAPRTCAACWRARPSPDRDPTPERVSSPLPADAPWSRRPLQPVA